MTAILSQDQVRAHGRRVCSDNEVLRRHGHFLRGVTSVVEDTWANAEQVLMLVIHVGVRGI